MSADRELMVRIADRRQAGENYLLVEISDTDSGIPVDLEDKAFSRFVTSKAHGERPATIRT